MEKIVKPMSGYLALVIALVSVIGAVYCFINADGNFTMYLLAVLLVLTAGFLLKGLMIINPNHSRVLNFFGKYVGSVKDNGLFFVNPLYTSHSLSLRSQNLQGQTLKVNDKHGNPIEIGAVIVWRIKDTYKAAYEVANYDEYVSTQSEASVRTLAVNFAYDNIEDEHADITLRNGGEKVNAILESELNERLAPAGIEIVEARISHLAYAPEIAHAMLQRQQATAIVAARSKIVEGAVGMVEMALDLLSKKDIVTLDEDKKATMVSNLMVVLCSDKSATPVVNTGTLYQ
jgi:regulator of protease activity HflC (stomatin/prohibitin superfamily)